MQLVMKMKMKGRHDPTFVSTSQPSPCRSEASARKNVDVVRD